MLLARTRTSNHKLECLTIKMEVERNLIVRSLLWISKGTGTCNQAGRAFRTRVRYSKLARWISCHCLQLPKQLIGQPSIIPRNGTNNSLAIHSFRCSKWKQKIDCKQLMRIKHTVSWEPLTTPPLSKIGWRIPAASSQKLIASPTSRSTKKTNSWEKESLKVKARRVTTY